MDQPHVKSSSRSAVSCPSYEASRASVSWITCGRGCSGRQSSSNMCCEALILMPRDATTGFEGVIEPIGFKNVQAKIVSDSYLTSGDKSNRSSADRHSNHPMNPKHPQADVSMEIQMENMPPSQSAPPPSDSRPRLASMHVPLEDYIFREDAPKKKKFNWEDAERLLDYEPEDPVIRFVNHVYFWCHRAGLIFTVCCLLPAMPFNAFFVGMTEILMSSLVKPWVGVLDQVWSRLHWKTVVFYCCLVLAAPRHTVTGRCNMEASPYRATDTLTTSVEFGSTNVIQLQ
ncbi:hypothetical protein PROFUN_08975 [Planoprotostelium fungivorum]|uniref:Uncharacterized protein n=1 Tax=Planoprotostelium fungivorum TaxID=1890364 RepID=A0A2P6NIL0_9EUKA|nr:hypothetical protein PROFUN_08975 [Planoprotostelium fungivorum]